MSVSLDQLAVGQSALIAGYREKGGCRHQLLSMGLTPGTPFIVRRVAPMGDPIQVEVRGANLCLRRTDAMMIFIEHVS